MSNGINKYTMVEKHLYGNVHENKENYQLNEIIVIYLNKESENELIQFLHDLYSKDIDIEKLKNELEIKHGFKMDKETERAFVDMTNVGDLLSRQAEQRGLELGLERGFEKGKNEGLAEGLSEGRLLAIVDMIINKMKKYNFSAIQAMKDLDIEEKDYSIYLPYYKMINLKSDNIKVLRYHHF